MLDIINPQNIQNPKIKLDFNTINGIGMIIEFDYKNENGEDKHFVRRLNKVINIDDNGNISIETRNLMGTIKNLYAYTPDLLFLASGNPAFFNTLKENFEKGYKELYGMVSYENKKIFVLPKPELDLKIKIEKDEVKDKNKELKVYETPSKVFDAIANILDKTLKEMFIEDVVKSKLLHLKNDIDYNILLLQLAKIETVSNALKQKNIKALKNEIGDKEFEKNKELIDFLINIPDENVLNYLKEHKRELVLFKLQNILNIKPLFMDFQAGSGVILESLKKKGFNATLIGTELRNIENNEPAYQVVTGVNFGVVKETIKNVLDNENRRKMIQSIFNYSNSSESINTIKQGSLVFGLYSTKMLSYLKDRIDGVIYQVPREATGYTDPNTPDNFLFVMGIKLSDEKIKNIQARMSPSSCKFIETSTNDLNSLKIPDNIIDKIKDNFVYSLKANYDNFKADFKKAIIETLEKYKNIETFTKIIEDNKNIIFNSFLPFENLKRNRIFPDTSIFAKNQKDIKYYTFMEVVQNIPLLNFYKKVNPELLTIVKKIAEELQYPMPKIEEENFRYSFTNNKPPVKNIVTNENLGMMKLKYYPDIIDISDEENKKILSDLINDYITKNNLDLSEKEINLLELIIQKANSLVLKNEITSMKDKILKNEVLVFVDKYGQNLGKFGISPSDFYHLMEEKGYFDIKDYVELAKLTDNEYKEIIKSFIDYMNNIKLKILEFNIANFKDFYNKGNKEELFKKFNDDLLNAFKKIYSLEKSNLDNKKELIIKEILNFANKYHLKEMFEERFSLISSKKMIDKAVNRYSKNLDKDTLKAISNEIFTHFDKREITFFETERAVFFNQLNEKYDLESKINFEDFMLDVEDALSYTYTVKKQIYTGYSKLADILIRGVLPLEKIFESNNLEKAKNVFEKIFTVKMGLKPHQFKEAINYLPIADKKRFEMLFWEMRAGKTRAMLATSFLLSLKNHKDIDIIVETANMNDIILQTLQSFPFLILNSNFFVGDNKKVNINNNHVYSTLPAEDIIPNLPKILQPYLVGKGKKAEEIAQTFYQDMEEIISKLNDENINQVENFFKKTMFASCLNVCKNG